MGMLDGLVAVVTGAGRGVGRAHAELLGAEGAKVVVNEAPGAEAAAHEVVAAIEAGNGQAAACIEDVASWDGAERLISFAAGAFGGLHVLVNNAGILRQGAAEESSEADWDLVLAVNLKGHVAPSRAAARHWRRLADSSAAAYGRIINTTSGAAFVGLPNHACYDTAKMGVVGLTLAMAQDLRDLPVTVNCIAPAARTRMTQHLAMMQTAGAAFDAFAPQTNSALVAWLASPAAAHVSGQVFQVGGDRVGLMSTMTPLASIDAGGVAWRPEALARAAPALFPGGKSRLDPPPVVE